MVVGHGLEGNARMGMVLPELRYRAVFCLLIALTCSAVPVSAGSVQKVPFTLRSKALTLTVYRPDAAVKGTVGTVIMGSGDAGWVGLAVKTSEFLASQGYLVVGLNVREYLSTFTEGPQHVSPEDVRADYLALSGFLRTQSLLRRPVLLSGVSEGAALAIVAAGDARNRSWVDGVIAMGVPATAELAWRWYDVAALITRSDANEPSFSPADYVGAVSPTPLVMIQSATDEYITGDGRARLVAASKPPRKMVMIGAGNHRFTDKLPELRQEFLSAIAWIAGSAPAGAGR